MVDTSGERRGRQPPINPVLTVIHKCDSYLVVDKPYDVRIDGDHDTTVEKMIQARYPDLGKIRLIHQLDYATSGVMCWGLTKKATASASRLFHDRLTTKRYLAILRGTLQHGSYHYAEAIADDPNHPFKMIIGTAECPGRAAETEARVLSWGTFHGEPVTKVVLSPKTGRRHQLRLHTSHAGFPIVGDATYTSDEESFRMMLHAWELVLPLPAGEMRFITQDPFCGLIENEILNTGGNDGMGSGVLSALPQTQ